MVDLILPLGVVLCFVFGWNNSSYIVGNLAGSGTLSLGRSAVVAALGMMAGVLLEGPKMLTSLVGSLAYPVPSSGILITLALSVALILALTLGRLPAPVSSAMVGAFLGVAYGLGSNINAGQAELVISFWFVAPFVAAILAFVFHRGLARLVSGFSLVGADSFNRVGVVAGSLAVSYTLGANNLGLIAGTSLSGAQSGQSYAIAVLFALVAVLGMLVLGRGGVSGTVGDRLLSLSPVGVISVFASSALLVWAGTQLLVPMSISQCVLGGMLGSAFSQKSAFINFRLAYEALSTWVLVPVVAFVVAFMLVAL